MSKVVSAGRRVVSTGANLVRWTFVQPDQLRHVPKWLASLLPGRSGFRDARPWMNFDTIGWLSRVLQPEWSVFEYGSGGSTLFFANRVSRVVSIEHHPDWYAIVRNELEARGLEGCDYRLITPKAVNRGQNAMFASELPAYADYDFDDYVMCVDAFPDASFEMIVVDGRCRVACIRRALRKLKPGGYLVLDNAQRDRYLPAHELLRNERQWRFTGCTPYQTNPATTVVWQVDKPDRYKLNETPRGS